MKKIVDNVCIRILVAHLIALIISLSGIEQYHRRT